MLPKNTIIKRGAEHISDQNHGDRTGPCKKKMKSTWKEHKFITGMANNERRSDELNAHEIQRFISIDANSMSRPFEGSDEEYSGAITITRGKRLSRNPTRNNTKMPVHDDLTWEICMNTKSLKGARRLLKSGHLPVWKEFEHFYTDASCKNIFLLTCKHISNRIKATSDRILQVYPAYRADDPKSIVFVVITKEESDNVVSEDYPVMCRCVDKYSNEGQDITNYRLSNNIYLTEKEAAKLQKCIQKNSKQLMKEHSNLTMISGCPCRSANYGSDKQVPIKETCIVLYVCVKRLIPIDEKQFKTRIDGIRVDVREGGFRFYGGAETRQDRLRIGCQIGTSSGQSGTLGLFIDYKNTTCCITSAHVVFDDAYMSRLSFQHSIPSEECESVKVFQPNTKQPDDMFGHVIQALYIPGENNKASFEIALIAVNKRHPINGRFPEKEGTDTKSQLQFSSAQICDRSQCLVGSEVHMFGSKSGEFTTGRVFINSTDILLRTNGNSSIPLRNQIAVEALPNQVFAQPGDSGAVVFMKVQEVGSDPELKALGILEGNTSDNKYLVTPIWDILEGLAHPQLKKFEISSLEEKIIKLEGTINQNFEDLTDLIMERTSQNNYRNTGCILL